MLDAKYDVNTAAARLEELASTRIESGYLMNPVASFNKELKWPTPVTTSQAGTAGNQAWRLSTTNERGEPEEVVLTVQGVLLLCDLPPIMRPFGANTSPRNLQQRAVLTGFNTPTFHQALEGLGRVNAFIRSPIREDTVPVLHTKQGGWYTLDISNRYFTSVRLSGDERHLPFDNLVDPKGYLERAKGQNFIHTAENVVEFFKRTVDGNGEQHFKRMPPAKLRVGDIVEVQFTMTMFETNERQGRKHLVDCTTNGYKTRLVLRAITLLDNKCSEDCRALAVAPTMQTITLKRKVGHDAEESDEARDRLKRMAIDKPSSE